MRNNIYIIFFALTTLFVACSHDINDGIDFISPKAVIENDTLEVTRGDSVTIRALIKDESGISSVTFTYSAWNINDDVVIDAENMPTEYDYSCKIKVPTDAALEWQENYQKHDGTTFLITQHYHKLSLTCYDGVKNKNIFYFYIKAK